MESGTVVEAAIVGIPDLLLENKLIAVAVPAQRDMTANTLLSLCASRLPGFKMPHDVLFVRDLPKTASGKIDKNCCKQLYEMSGQNDN
jgi:long-chain acyl-CoA synthetase